MARKEIEVVSGEMDWYPDSLGPEWDTPGLIIRLTPKDENGDWFTEVVSSATVKRSPKLKTIPENFEEGKLVAVRAVGLPLSDYESDWLQGVLYKELNSTFMPFKCGTNPSTNIINVSPSLVALWNEYGERILEAIRSEGYDLESKKYFNQPDYTPASTEIVGDEQEIAFAGRLKLKVKLTNPNEPRVHVEIFDPTTSTVLQHSTTQLHIPQPKDNV